MRPSRLENRGRCLALCGAVAAALVGCGGSDGTLPVTPPPPPPTLVIVAPASVAVGGTLSMLATAIPAGQISWTSNTPSIVAVSPDGKVTGVSPGTGEVKASSGGESATANVIALPPFVDLTLGRSHACARTAQNVLYCWGDNAVAALGKTSPEICPSQLRQCSTLPRSLVEATNFVQLSGGGSGITCGLTSGGNAFCWGHNRDDWIGPTTDTCTVEGVGTSACARTPVAVPGGRVFTSIALGGAHACALTPGGAAYCWGLGGDQLGVASTETCAGAPCNRTPLAVAGGLSFTTLAPGNQHTCGIAVGGAAYCWGDNAVGQLGRPGPGGPAPTLVSGGHSFLALSAYSTQTCGVETGGDAYCWGDNGFGQLGDNSTAASSVPRLVAGGLKFTVVAASLEHTCGLTIAGGAYCWGQNTGLQVSGQLGNGSTTPSQVPVPVAGGRAFVQLLAGRQATCGRTASGLVYCWGDNRFGQLGIGNLTLAYSLLPLGVAGAP